MGEVIILLIVFIIILWISESLFMSIIGTVIVSFSLGINIETSIDTTVSVIESKVEELDKGIKTEDYSYSDEEYPEYKNDPPKNENPYANLKKEFIGDAVRNNETVTITNGEACRSSGECFTPIFRRHHDDTIYACVDIQCYKVE